MEWKRSKTAAIALKLKIYERAESKWERIAERLGLNPHKIRSIQQDRHDDHQRVTAVFMEWLENANQLSNHKKYPKKWSGLVKLLKDSELGQLAEDLMSALSAPFNDVKGNLHP